MNVHRGVVIRSDSIASHNERDGLAFDDPTLCGQQGLVDGDYRAVVPSLVVRMAGVLVLGMVKPDWRPCAPLCRTLCLT